MNQAQEERLLPLALRAAARAAEVIMDIYKSADTQDLGVRQKEDNTPVTRADMASNQAIAEALAPSNIPILSEETVYEDYVTRESYPLLWVVDPLDGTKEFIKRNDMFAVCIALVENHRAVMGVVAVPVLGQVYFTQGGKAYRATLSANGEAQNHVLLPITFGPVPHIVLSSVSHPSPSAQHLEGLLKSKAGWTDVTLLGVGSCIKQCMIAEGSAAFYPRMGTTMEWDTAAGQAIIEAAGGSLLLASFSPDGTAIDLGSPLTYNRPVLKNPDFLAVAHGIDLSVFGKI